MQINTSYKSKKKSVKVFDRKYGTFIHLSNSRLYIISFTPTHWHYSPCLNYHSIMPLETGTDIEIDIPCTQPRFPDRIVSWIDRRFPLVITITFYSNFLIVIPGPLVNNMKRKYFIRLELVSLYTRACIPWQLNYRFDLWNVTTSSHSHLHNTILFLILLEGLKKSF